MSERKNIVFLTGTRADFGKLRPLIETLDTSEEFDFSLFVTGMHTSYKYGYTVNEVFKALDEDKLSQGPHSVYTYINHSNGEPMEQVLANTIMGLSRYVAQYAPDLIVVHGDRVEALAGAIVGALQNIYVAHIEGGERSGTVDELIRHAVTKLSHIHFVANDEAAQRLKQLGEKEEAVYVIGSPDIDIMLSPNLPAFNEAQERYDIPFEHYGILLYHPVTTSLQETEQTAKSLVNAVLADDHNYIIIYPNNDKGAEAIFREYRRVEGNERFRVYPSLRFPYFLSMLNHSDFILGNSSAGVREAPVYGVPSINVGSRQNNRFCANSIIDVESWDGDTIADAIQTALKMPRGKPSYYFGEGNSAENFLKTIKQEKLWQTPKQKQFMDLDIHSLMCQAVGQANKQAQQNIACLWND